MRPDNSPQPSATLVGFRPKMFQTNGGRWQRLPVPASAAATTNGDGSTRGSGNCARNNALASAAPCRVMPPPFASVRGTSPATRPPPRHASGPARGRKGPTPPPSPQKAPRTSQIVRPGSRFQWIDTRTGKFVYNFQLFGQRLQQQRIGLPPKLILLASKLALEPRPWRGMLTA